MLESGDIPYCIQVRMAEIFTKIFGKKLAKDNLVELNNLDRLPSPHQLQGKIILKGTVQPRSQQKEDANGGEDDDADENDLLEVALTYN